MSVFHYLCFMAAVGLFLLLLDAFSPKKARELGGQIAVWTSALVLARLLFFGVRGAAADLPALVRPWLADDGAAAVGVCLVLLATLGAGLLTRVAQSYLQAFTLQGGTVEFYALPLIMAAGMGWMMAASDLITLFVSLELVTVSFYVLVAIARRNALCLEAGVKYLILGALSTGVLVMGIAWIYGVCGTLQLEGIANALSLPATSKSGALLACALLLAAIGFKVAAAPFHGWVPDVYQGAPLPVTVLLSVASKTAGVVVMLRLFETMTAAGSVVAQEVRWVLLGMGALSVLLGSLPALHQDSVKRLLGFSSISHAGFILLGLAGAESVGEGRNLVVFYLCSYLPMTLLAFLVLTILRAQGMGDRLADFQGLAKRSPALAAATVVAFASLAGLPLFLGFWGKWMVFMQLVAHGHVAGLLAALVGAAVGFYYYFRPILACFQGAEDESLIRLDASAKGLLVGLTIAVAVLGLYPAPLGKISSSSVRGYAASSVEVKKAH